MTENSPTDGATAPAAARRSCPNVLTPAEEADLRESVAGRPVRKIAVAGKGGTGKTTVAGTLARILARRGEKVWAIDADSNPNLGLTLGLPRDEVTALTGLPRDLLSESYDDEGRRHLHLTLSPDQVAASYGTPAPDGIRLLLMGTIHHAGAG